MKDILNESKEQANLIDLVHKGGHDVIVKGITNCTSFNR